MLAGVRIISRALGLCAWFFAAMYLGPAELANHTRSGEQDSVVQALDSLGPVWPVLFVFAGAGVLFSARRRRWAVPAHGIAAGVWVFYGLATLLGAILSEPPVPVLTGGLAISAAVIHYGAARCWADWGIK